MIKNLFGAVKGVLGGGDDAPPSPAYTRVAPEESFMILKDKYQDTEFELHNNVIHINGLQGKSVIPLTEGMGIGQVDKEIREQIAKKIAMLVPSLAESKKDLLMVHVFKVLSMLAEDQETRVRRMIAEELSNSYNAPMEIVNKLAWDTELEVCAPVLESSPLLGDADLMAIIAKSDIPGVKEAIASRKEVSENVTDAIVDSIDINNMSQSDEAAIKKLLGNKGAHFSESAFETIVEGAEAHEAWHESLVQREELTNRTINKVARFISHALIEDMHKRGLINAEVNTQLASALNSRLKSVLLDREKEADRIAQELLTHGQLNNEEVLSMVNSGKFDLVNAALVLLSGLPKPVIKAIWEAQDAKAVIALAWKAGLAMRDTIPLQLKCGGIPHTQVIYAKNGLDFPLSENEMQKILASYSKKG